MSGAPWRAASAGTLARTLAAHGVRVAPVDLSGVDGGPDTRLAVWDFGGQADQRLIHQLYMDETALAVAGQLMQLPGPSYAWNKKAIRKTTLDRIKASIGAHHKL